MSVLRKEKKGNFTVIDNAIFKDRNLSLKAKGLLCLMLSLPDGWNYSIAGLVNLSTDGESAVRSTLKELETAGYFRREQVRENGKIIDTEYVISETKNCDFPLVENQVVGNQVVGNPRQLNTKELNTNQSTTNKSTTKGIYEAEFEYLWSIYPKKQGKDKAYKSYEKARLKGTTCREVEQGILAYKEHIRRNRIEPQYIKMGSTYFSQKAWQDVYEVKEVSSGNPFMDMLRGGIFDD